MANYDRLEIYARDGFRCCYCGFDGGTFDTWKFLEIDHINPKGPNESSNVVTSCHYCNGCKGNDPCETLEQGREIVSRHNQTNFKYWQDKVLPIMLKDRSH